jgi:histidinol dehydrogenase
VTETVAEARALTNRLAPEHLSVDSAADLKWVQNAGSVFVGDYAPQSMGDYISGPNHVLPTGRVGRVRGGLSVMDFVKIITVQDYTREGLNKLGPHAIALAEAEGLVGHAESIRVRMRSTQ